MNAYKVESDSFSYMNFDVKETKELTEVHEVNERRWSGME